VARNSVIFTDLKKAGRDLFMRTILVSAWNDFEKSKKYDVI
jgi:hypothetical protein